MYSATQESVTVARGQRQENTDRSQNNQIAGIVAVPSEKNIAMLCMQEICFGVGG